MELNEIKKLIYKEKPIAVFERASKSSIVYGTRIQYAEDDRRWFYFNIPINDMGDATFEKTMPAQQLIRWLVIPETENK